MMLRGRCLQIFIFQLLTPALHSLKHRRFPASINQLRGFALMSSTIPDLEDLSAYPVHTSDFHSFSESEVKCIQESLLSWYDNKRKTLPWRGDPPPYLTASNGKNLDARNPERLKKSNHLQVVKCSDSVAPQVTPYSIWVSEIMCQQTRVETAVSYYLEWMEKFPTVESLANADIESINNVWAGLGYYRRAMLLLKGAQYVMERCDGRLPTSVCELQKVPGIGPYTAGAISSIAFGCKEPVVDGNVMRIFSRLRACAASPDDRKFQNLCWLLAASLVPAKRPGDFNQALMEFGSLMCTPKSPSCHECPLKSCCKTIQLSSAESVQFDRSDKQSTCDICELTESGRCRPPESVEDFPFKKNKAAPKVKVMTVCVIFRKKSVEIFDGDKCVSDGSESEISLVPSNMEVLMTRRDMSGLLAGQWECPNILHNSSSSDLDEEETNERVNETCANLLNQLNLTHYVTNKTYTGKIVHVFSHERHTMFVVTLFCNLLLPTAAPVHENGKNELRWMDQTSLTAIGITTGVKKVLLLASKSPLESSKRRNEKGDRTTGKKNAKASKRQRIER